jgi:hypothetical protein
MLPKNTQYLIAGAIGLYIVLMTRPAPAMITNLLSSSVAQIAALALVIYVGATQSLIVAVVLAVAVVMSTPSREYMTMEEKNASDKKTVAAKKPAVKAAAKPVKDLGKEATKPTKPTPSTAEPKPATGPKTTEPTESGEPAPAGQTVATSAPTTGSEKFSLMNAADF